jgi:hypothetical protein
MFSLKINNILVFAFLAIASLVGTSSTFAQGNGGGNNNAFHGAIYTSTKTGTSVNENQYDAKKDVYLNGGPQNNAPHGLPNEVFYFQVTGPNGGQQEVLLSQDNAVCRQLYVVNGAVAGVLPRVSDLVPANLPSNITARRPDSCPAHANGDFNPANGSTPVQLIPFSDTPNPGGVYSVNLIRKTSSTTISTTDPKVITYEQNNAKNDNFKIKLPVVCVPPNPACTDPTVTLSGTKFYDANANHQWDGALTEPGIGGFKIIVTTFDLDPENGNRTNVDVLPTIDTKPNGTWSQVINRNKYYEVVEVVPPRIPENSFPYWRQTYPLANSQGLRGHSGHATTDISDLDFGNICFVQSLDGRTLGFWSNQNGKKAMENPSTGGMNSALAFLTSLNLRDFNGNHYDPSSYNTGATGFRSWLLSGNAVNMSYMLSVQMAATELSMRAGLLSRNSIVDATGYNLPDDFVTLGTEANYANFLLAGSQDAQLVTRSGNSLRITQEAWKNFLDAVNNNRLGFASSTPCSPIYPQIPPVVNIDN